MKAQAISESTQLTGESVLAQAVIRRTVARVEVAVIAKGGSTLTPVIICTAYSMADARPPRPTLPSLCSGRSGTRRALAGEHTGSVQVPPFPRGVDRGHECRRHDAARERLWVFRANTLTVRLVGKATRGIQSYNGRARPAWVNAQSLPPRRRGLIQCGAGSVHEQGSCSSKGSLHRHGPAQPRINPTSATGA
jgi:hypothetical protein